MPRTTRQYFCLKTLLTSTSKPVASTTSGEKISRAGKEYYNCAARLNLRFYELIRMVNTGLKAQVCKDVSVVGYMQSLLFGDSSRLEQVDQGFIRKFKSELKHFEICLRVFEECCIGAIYDTQQALLERNIDLLCQKDAGTKEN